MDQENVAIAVWKSLEYLINNPALARCPKENESCNGEERQGKD